MLISLSFVEDKEPNINNCYLDNIWTQRTILRTVSPKAYEEFNIGSIVNSSSVRNIKIEQFSIKYEVRRIRWVARVESVLEMQQLIRDIGVPFTLMADELNPGYWVAEW